MNRFTGRQTPHGNVVLNFRGRPVEDLSPFAQGYHIAARALAEQLAAQSGYADYEGYPIVFLYRHALELYLKAVVYKGAAVVGLMSSRMEEPPLFKHHGLTRLLPSLRVIFDALEWTLEDTPLGSFEGLSQLVREVEELDRDSFAFRYPITSSGAPAVEHHFTVDVLYLAEQLEPLLRLLEGSYDALHEHFYALCEARAEMAQYLEYDGDA